MPGDPTNRQPPPNLKLVTSDAADGLYAAPEADPSAVARVPSSDHRQKMRIVEALLFASADPLDAAALALHLGPDDDVAALLGELQAHYTGRGVVLSQVAGRWAFRTAPDLGYLLQRHATSERRLSKAALETLAIIAYHQPVTRAEIEEIRGVSTSKGTLDVLLETLWVRPRGRRRAPGRPVTYGTTPKFLDHFGLDALVDLPGLAELKGAGLLDATVPINFQMPTPMDLAGLMPDELPLDDDDEDFGQVGLPFDADIDDEVEDADGAAEAGDTDAVIDNSGAPDQT